MIICLKLTSGDELIATCADQPLAQLQCATNVSLAKVRVIGLQQVGANEVGVGVMPWTIGDVNAEVTLNFDKHVVVVYAPKYELEKSYLKQTTGIALI